MSLKLIHTDLTRFHCDAVVLSTDENLEYGGSVFGLCSSVAGPALHTQLSEADGCETGQAIHIQGGTSLSGLRCEHLIITAAPFWKDGTQNETELLKSCYQSSLDEAVRHGCIKIGISLIDSRIYGFPKELARETAVQAILEYPRIRELDVYLITFDWRSYGDYADRILDLERYINRSMQITASAASNSLSAHTESKRKNLFGAARKGFAAKNAEMQECAFYEEAALPLEARLKQLDEGFSEMLLRKIDEAGIKDSECYKKANVSKQLFSKIRSDPYYRPKKETVLAFALALELNLDETNALLKTAGYSLSHSNKSDIIIEYFISQHIFNVFVINEALYTYDQPVLGSD